MFTVFAFSFETRNKTISNGSRSFAYAAPSNWNSLPAYLRDSSLSLSSFKHHLKTIYIFTVIGLSIDQWLLTTYQSDAISAHGHNLNGF